MTANRTPPTEDEILDYLRRNRNWGRWGDLGDRGAINLITDETRNRALSTVRSARTISLSRPLSTWVGTGNDLPVQHYMRVRTGGGLNTTIDGRATGGAAIDYFGMVYHGLTTTHLDALCHVWDGDGMFDGHDPATTITTDGATFGGVEHLADGILTRGIIIDVPRFRGTEYVTQAEPVHGWELEEILSAREVELLPGDAVCVYAGRERWQAANPDKPYGRYPFDGSRVHGGFEKPGLHASCLPFLRDHDVSVLVWDMLEATPFPYNMPYTVHSAIHAFGTMLVDNALLEPLAATCAAEGRDDFMLVLAPLPMVGATGSPLNPLAVL